MDIYDPKYYTPEKKKFQQYYGTPEPKMEKKRFEENYFQRTTKKEYIQIDELLRFHEIEEELNFLRKYVSQLEVILFNVRNKNSNQNSFQNNYQKNLIEKQKFKISNYYQNESPNGIINKYSQKPGQIFSQNRDQQEITPKKQIETIQKQKAFDINWTPQTQNWKKQNSKSQPPQNNYINKEQFENRPNLQEQEKTEKKVQPNVEYQQQNKWCNQQEKKKTEEFIFKLKGINRQLNSQKKEKKSQFVQKEPIGKEKEDKVEANEQKLEQQQEDNQFQENQDVQNENPEVEEKEEIQVEEDQSKEDALLLQQQDIKQEKSQFQLNENRLKIVIQTINQLIEASGANQRHVEHRFRYFVQEKEDKTELFSNYSIKSLAVKKNLQKICDSIQKVRGDGNCFYTAFGYQFLDLLLNDFSNKEYQQFINWIQEINLRFKIICKDFLIDNVELETQLREEFLFKLQQLKNIESVEERNINLFTQFREFQISEDGTGCLYPLSTLFFRNLSDYLLEFHELKDEVFDRINLITWEEECDNNELIISNLAEHLKLKIKLVFIQENDFNLREYGDQNNREIILLIHPGHYNIGKKTG